MDFFFVALAHAVFHLFFYLVNRNPSAVHVYKATVRAIDFVGTRFECAAAAVPFPFTNSKLILPLVGEPTLIANHRRSDSTREGQMYSDAVRK